VYYIPDFVTPELEAAILGIAAAVPEKHPQWVRVRGRRLQCYGGALVGVGLVCVWEVGGLGVGCVKRKGGSCCLWSTRAPSLLIGHTHTHTLKTSNPPSQKNKKNKNKGEPTDAFQPKQLPAWVAQLSEALVSCGVFTREMKPNHVLLNGVCVGGWVVGVKGSCGWVGFLI
jgi:hypothetical protein